MATRTATTSTTTRSATIRATMSRFAPHMSTIALPDRDLSLQSFGASRTLEFLKSTSSNEAIQIALTSFLLCNDGDYSEAQACAYYLSGLTAIFPGLEAVAKDVLHTIGYNIQVITSETAAEYMIDILDWIEIPTLAVIFGQAILLLYENVTDANYEAFIFKRNGGLKSAAGILGSLSTGGEVVFSIERAKMIRARLGSSQKLRSEVLYALMTNRDVSSPMGGVCNYACEILSWTEMAYLVFIFEVLCITKSPVLSDARVQGEVRNLYQAYLKINAATYPQYFKILSNASSCSVLMKSKFPVLISVAVSVRAEDTATASGYVAPLSSEHPLVSDLKRIHTQYMTAYRTTGQSRHVSYLTTVDPP